jgi:hypothetical protein
MGVRGRTVRLAVVVLVAAAASIAATTPVPAHASTLPPGTALIYGDSLTMESRYVIAGQALKKKGWNIVSRAYGGTGPCDWIQWLPADLAQWHPSVVAISTAGNAGQTTCMNGTVIGSPDYFDKYRQHLDTFFALVTQTGARLVYFNAPPFGDPARDAAARMLNQIAVELAYKYRGVSVSGTIRSTFGGNKYTAYKKCLATETAAQGCVNGLIPIRTVPPAPDAGLHLCPTGLLGTPVIATCPEYSSGEVRWGRIVVNGVVSPPNPKVP